MLKGRRCYCDRLYPGFQCAYCRLDDVIADDVKPDPRTTPAPSGPTAAVTKWLSRAAAYGKSLFEGKGMPR